MALYEVVREIQNECANNQMRDVFFDEVETDDPVQTVREMLRDEKDLKLTVETKDEDNLTVFADCSGWFRSTCLLEFKAKFDKGACTCDTFVLP